MTKTPGGDASAPPLLSVNGLGIGLPPGGDRAEAVTDISFQIHPGETLCLVGESGSGKSVIGQAILGMLPRALPVTGGSIRLQDKVLPSQRDAAYQALRSVRMAMIFQDAGASLNPVKRVGRQLEEILKVHGVPAAERRDRVLDMFEAVRLPDPARIFAAYPHQLSGGQAQRVVIAGALLLKPALLVADEPTTALDVTTQAEILDLIAALKADTGASVLFITHDFGVVAEIADRVAVMKDGRIVEAGRAGDVLDRPQHPYTQRLIAASRPTGATPSRAEEAPILEADGLHLTYRSGPIFNRRVTQAVRDVSLSLAPGRTLAVVGESGSGKSSLARCLLRLEEVERGTIRFKGADITHLAGRDLQRLRKSVQVVLQDPYSALNPRQTIRSAIAEGPIIHGMPVAEARRKAEDLLELTGLTAQSADRYPHEFSGGQRQRICIARALALEPELLIADEAVSALDVSIQAQILDLFRDMQARFGFAMVFITHDLRVARAISDDILVMQQGRVVESGATGQVFDRPAHAYTRALLAAAPGLGLAMEEGAA
ncbi:dipeptide ABC transporter ATP-binding protein [Rhodophyticola porphyridii]|uniref:dipeptide ABC transporter ATP-binding protein n=1 Tax=Rhodophyticola porphyridii TaxID=1852017 RepID=UPI0035CF2E06